MYILDFECMLDIVRYTKINIDANDPTEVYPGKESMNPASNVEFLVKCASRIPRINFVDRISGMIYGGMESGKMCWVDPDMIQRILDEEAALAALQAMVPNFAEKLPGFKYAPAIALSDEVRRHIIGAMN
jgi:hypothetical protein